ncbi:hypothetical protein EBT31_07485 [bacterium]|nr:hypothetical protein [bacterium]
MNPYDPLPGRGTLLENAREYALEVSEGLLSSYSELFEDVLEVKSLFGMVLYAVFVILGGTGDLTWLFAKSNLFSWWVGATGLIIGVPSILLWAALCTARAVRKQCRDSFAHPDALGILIGSVVVVTAIFCTLVFRVFVLMGSLYVLGNLYEWVLWVLLP